MPLFAQQGLVPLAVGKLINMESSLVLSGVVNLQTRSTNGMLGSECLQLGADNTQGRLMKCIKATCTCPSYTSSSSWIRMGSK